MICPVKFAPTYIKHRISVISGFHNEITVGIMLRVGFTSSISKIITLLGNVDDSAVRIEFHKA